MINVRNVRNFRIQVGQIYKERRSWRTVQAVQVGKAYVTLVPQNTHEEWTIDWPEEKSFLLHKNQIPDHYILDPEAWANVGDLLGQCTRAYGTDVVNPLIGNDGCVVFVEGKRAHESPIEGRVLALLTALNNAGE